MKTRIIAGVLLVALCLQSTGCFSGPWKLRKSWEDVTDRLYSQNAWVHGALLQDILPIYPLVNFLFGVADWLFVNPWYFWTNDAWTNRGTTLVHDNSRHGRLNNVFTGGSLSDHQRFERRDQWQTDWP